MRKRAVADSTTGERKSELGALPEWDLSDLYSGPESEALQSDLAVLAKDADAFRAQYHDRLADLPGDALGAAVEEL